jgi:hypothetical protein
MNSDTELMVENLAERGIRGSRTPARLRETGATAGNVCKQTVGGR